MRRVGHASVTCLSPPASFEVNDCPPYEAEVPRMKVYRAGGCFVVVHRLLARGTFEESIALVMDDR